MPIYEYRCSACGHELESLQKFSDAPLVTCPACGKDALTKLVSAAGFQLKGSGWYATDFKGSGGKPAAKTRQPDAKARSAGEVRQRGAGKGGGEGRTAPQARRGQARDAGCTRRRAGGTAGGRRLSILTRATTLAAMKRYLIAGLLVWVPLGITIWVLHFLVTTLDQTLLLVPEGARPDSAARASTFRASACC